MMLKKATKAKDIKYFAQGGVALSDHRLWKQSSLRYPGWINGFATDGRIILMENPCQNQYRNPRNYNQGHTYSLLVWNWNYKTDPVKWNYYHIRKAYRHYITEQKTRLKSKYLNDLVQVRIVYRSWEGRLSYSNKEYPKFHWQPRNTYFLFVTYFTDSWLSLRSVLSSLPSFGALG